LNYDCRVETDKTGSMRNAVKDKKSLIVYLSPNGSTRLVAETIGDTLADIGYGADYLDLGSPRGRAMLPLKNIKHYDVVWIGSPVYANHALPPVMDFISGLGGVKGMGAVPFVTYGLVTSGPTLLEMGERLHQKGCIVLGAVKVPALHALLRLFEHPLGQGRPNEDDLSMVRILVREVAAKLQAKAKPDGLPNLALAYQPDKLRDQFGHGVAELREKSPPMKLDKDLCTECGVCVEKCPAGNINLDPLPRFGDRCLLCYNCVRYCAPGALTNDIFEVVEANIMKRKEKFAEPEETVVFY
jgi:ferredoxin/flavodoxin